MNSDLRKWAYVSAKLKKLLSKHIPSPLHTHPIQAHPFLFIKVKESLRIKRPQVQILPSAPRTARVLSPLAGFFITE